MNEILRKFDTIKFVAPWSIFKNFLGIFFEFKFKFWIWAGLVPDQTGTGPDRFDRNRAGPVWPVTGQTGPVTDGSVNPGCTCYIRFSFWHIWFDSHSLHSSVSQRDDSISPHPGAALILLDFRVFLLMFNLLTLWLLWLAHHRWADYFDSKWIAFISQ